MRQGIPSSRHLQAILGCSEGQAARPCIVSVSRPRNPSLHQNHLIANLQQLQKRRRYTDLYTMACVGLGKMVAFKSRHFHPAQQKENIDFMWPDVSEFHIYNFLSVFYAY